MGKRGSFSDRGVVLDLKRALDQNNLRMTTPSDTSRKDTLAHDAIFEDLLQGEFEDPPKNKKKLGFVAKNPYVLSRQTYGKTQTSMDNFRFN